MFSVWNSVRKLEGGRGGDKSGHTYVCSLIPSTKSFLCTRLTCADFCVVGASVSEPHTSELNDGIFLISICTGP